MSEELKIEIGGIIDNTFDYTLPLKELDELLSSRMKFARSVYGVRKDDVQIMEYAMLGYALDFIDFARNNFDLEMNFDEENLARYCEILGAVRKSFSEEPPPADFFNGFVKGATGFFGIMVIKNLGGNWAQSNIGMTVIHNGTSAFVQNRVARYMQNGEDDMAALYNVLKGA